MYAIFGIWRRIKGAAPAHSGALVAMICRAVQLGLSAEIPSPLAGDRVFAETVAEVHGALASALVILGPANE